MNNKDNFRFLLRWIILFYAIISVQALKSQQYQYDQFNRLTKVTYTSGYEITYTYDKLGNRLSKTVRQVDSRVLTLEGVLDFSGVDINQSKTLTYTITNSGNQPLELPQIVYPSGFQSNWESGTIAAGGQQQVQVTFSPTEAKEYNGSITFESNKTFGASSFDIMAKGLLRTLLVEGSLSFGQLDLGTTKDQIFTITNTGNDKLTITSFNAPEGFTVSPDMVEIAPAASFNITVSFSPTIEKDYSGPLTFTSDQMEGDKEIAISAIGFVATRVIELSTDSDFPEVPVGQSNQNLYQVENLGNSPMNITQITAPPGFSVDWQEALLEPNSSKYLQVTFAPAEAIEYSGLLSIISDKTDGESEIQLKGSGIEASRVMEIIGDGQFSDLIVGQVSSKEYQIKNSGNSPLNITTVSLPEGFTSDWTETILDSNTSKEFTVTFEPTEGKVYSGKLSFDSDKTSGVSEFELTATAIAITKVIEITGETSFPDTPIGESNSLDYEVKNTGNSSLSITDIEVAEGFSVNWQEAILAPDSSLPLYITFAPTESKTYSTAITFISDKTSGENEINVTGIGFTGTRIIGMSQALDLGSTTVGKQFTYLFEISNKGNLPLEISDISVPEGFSVSQSTSEVAPDDKLEVNLTFSPTEAKNYNGELTVISNKTDGKNTLSLAAQGTESILSLESSIDFGEVELGTTVSKDLVLRNLGNQKLSVSSFEIEPADNFVIEWHSDFDIPEGANHTLKVNFTPTEHKDYASVITFESDKTRGENTMSISGKGFKTDRTQRLSTDTLTFEMARVDNPVTTNTLYIENTGNKPLLIEEINIQGEEFITSFSGLEILPDNAKGIEIDFVPVENGIFYRRLTIVSNKTQGPSQIVLKGIASIAILSLEDHLLAEVGISIYPNPATDLLTIDTSFGSIYNYRVSISDLSGKTVIADRKFRGIVNTIDLKGLSQGLYVLTVNTGNRSYQKRIIIQK